MLTPETISELNELHAKAEKIYGPVGDNFRGESALSAEYREVIRAFDARDWHGLRDELMDIANVATRWAQAIESGEVAPYKRELAIHSHDGDGFVVTNDALTDVVVDMMDRLTAAEESVLKIRRELDDADSYRREQSERES